MLSQGVDSKSLGRVGRKHREIQRTRAIFERIEPFMGDRACSRDTEGGASTFRLLEVQGVSRLSLGIEVITVASFLDHLPIAWMSRLLLILGLAACGSDPEPRTIELRGTYSGTTVIGRPRRGDRWIAATPMPATVRTRASPPPASMN